MLNAKGQTAWNALTIAGLSVGLLVLIVAVIAEVLSGIGDMQDPDSEEWQVTEAGILALALFGNWFSIVIIVGVAGVVITLLVLAFHES